MEFSLIDNRESVSFIDSPGVGKTQLAIVGLEADPSIGQFDVTIIDFVIHHSNIFMPEGDSYRLKQENFRLAKNEGQFCWQKWVPKK